MLKHRIMELGLVMFLAGTSERTLDTSFELDIPLDCNINQNCWVVNYFDQDPSDKAADYRCGPHSYDTHAGTDFAIPDLAAMREGVSVVASAGGTVVGVRSHMQDISVAEIGGRSALKGLDCGNGVSIDHGNGWLTQYCHMRRDSIVVRTGDRVDTGDKLGLVGLSGNTIFPHVHLSVFKDDKKIDPYSINGELSCTGDPEFLWANHVKGDLKYMPAVPYIAGFATERADSKKARNGNYDAKTFDDDTPIITFWADHYNLRKGDKLTMSILAPNGEVVSENTKTMDKNKARWFQFIGRRKPKSGWPRGTYMAEIKVYPFDQDSSAVRRKVVRLEIE
jgi:murein DD-endopeptidase MepM/ murein hydrolase activator NlpD